MMTMMVLVMLVMLVVVKMITVLSVKKLLFVQGFSLFWELRIFSAIKVVLAEHMTI